MQTQPTPTLTALLKSESTLQLPDWCRDRGLKQASASLPPELSGVRWPPQIQPLGTFLDTDLNAFVLLSIPVEYDPDLIFKVRHALAEAGLPGIPSLSQLIESGPSVFQLNERYMLTTWENPADQLLLLRLIPWPEFVAHRDSLGWVDRGLHLTLPEELSWAQRHSEDLALQASSDSDLERAFQYWTAEAEQQGWSADEPLMGANGGLLTMVHSHNSHIIQIVAKSDKDALWLIWEAIADRST